MAQGHQWEIRNHVLGGLGNGLTAQEILEAVIQTIPYIGLPAAGQAMSTAARALDE
jgi:alkylhydroperoxidase/carboxymuconolactone decarboxylase family protein YurZ